jgi:uridine kinase
MSKIKKKSIIILVGGGSCSGKSTLGKNIFHTLSGIASVEKIAMDDYYKDLGTKTEAELEKYNFDCPEAINAPLLLEHLHQLLNGESVPRQSYDFKTHAISYTGAMITPADFIIVEGIFALYFVELRQMASISFFMDCPPDLRLIKRIRRDRAERGMDVDAIILQYWETVRPMHELYIAPGMKHADVILDSDTHDASTNLQISMKILTGKYHL